MSTSNAMFWPALFSGTPLLVQQYAPLGPCRGPPAAPPVGPNNVSSCRVAITASCSYGGLDARPDHKNGERKEYKWQKTSSTATGTWREKQTRSANAEEVDDADEEKQYNGSNSPHQPSPSPYT
ncbi:hypothetical protein BDP67DRAFT_494664 [Colletotrichum lupini]|nr:hypothetical protein BDP67DRAFT_494664 [Colletotrichum lupini]